MASQAGLSADSSSVPGRRKSGAQGVAGPGSGSRSTAAMPACARRRSVQASGAASVAQPACR
eukprot:3220699-Lingulodinium_polyedra.AAC.1